jgi:hypothetical protein
MGAGGGGSGLIQPEFGAIAQPTHDPEALAAWYDFLRKVIGSAGKSLGSSNGAKPSAAK